MGVFSRKKKEEIPAEEAAKYVEADDTLEARQFGRKLHTEGPIRFANAHGDRLPGGGRDPYAATSADAYSRRPTAAMRATGLPGSVQRAPPGRQVSDPYGDPYGGDPYGGGGRARGAGRSGMGAGADPYNPGDADAADEKDRQELLGGYGTRQGGDVYGGENNDAYSPNDPYTQNGSVDSNVYGQQADTQGMDEEDVEVDGIKTQMRGLKQESVASTRNTRRVALEAVETLGGSLDMLGQQTDRLVNAEQIIDRSKGYNSRAGDETARLKQLKRSVFLPKNPFVWDKKAKRDAAEAKLLARHIEERTDREIARRVQYESRQRINHAFAESDKIAEDGAFEDHTGRTSERQRYQFEATPSDDELEDEIDDNLNDAQNVIARMKQMALAQNQEVQSQNRQIARIDGKAEDLDLKIFSNTRRLANIK